MSESTRAQRATPHILTESLRSHSAQEGKRKGREEEGNANATHRSLWFSSSANAADPWSVVGREPAGFSNPGCPSTDPNARKTDLWTSR